MQRNSPSAYYKALKRHSHYFWIDRSSIDTDYTFDASRVSKVNFIRKLYTKQNCPKNILQYSNLLQSYLHKRSSGGARGGLDGAEPRLRIFEPYLVRF